MKKQVIRLFLILTITGFCSLAIADDVTYTASMSGIECSGCKKKIIASLAKIDGVKSIRVSRAKKKGFHQLTVVTSGSAISKEQAAAAIKHAEHYKIVTWASK